MQRPPFQTGCPARTTCPPSGRAQTAPFAATSSSRSTDAFRLPLVKTPAYMNSLCWWMRYAVGEHAKGNWRRTNSRRDWSHDLEDILTVLDGRAAVLEEIAQSPDALKHYLADQFSALVSEPDFIQCLPGHIPPDSASQERVPILLETIHQITQMQEGKP